MDGLEYITCPVCDDFSYDNWQVLFSYNLPDKYESYMGITDIDRTWKKCKNCGFIIQTRNYNLRKLEQIYKYGYRDEKFRGETIDQAYDRIINLKESENVERFKWFTSFVDSFGVLDIGSGLGVWPSILKDAGYNITCCEENELSIDFIYEKLGLKCYQNIDSIKEKFDTVSIVHVLEHIEDPVRFLHNIKDRLSRFGFLFVEVPDSSEFNYLSKDHDEFNSCHVAFYNIGTLYNLLSKSGFLVKEMHIERTSDRNLTRIFCLAISES